MKSTKLINIEKRNEKTISFLNCNVFFSCIVMLVKRIMALFKPIRLIIDENVKIESPIVNKPSIFLSDKKRIVILKIITPEDEINFNKKVSNTVFNIKFFFSIISFIK